MLFLGRWVRGNPLLFSLPSPALEVSRPIVHLLGFRAGPKIPTFSLVGPRPPQRLCQQRAAKHVRLWGCQVGTTANTCYTAPAAAELFMPRWANILEAGLLADMMVATVVVAAPLASPARNSGVLSLPTATRWAPWEGKICAYLRRRSPPGASRGRPRRT